jgi:hypothetical protein
MTKDSTIRVSCDICSQVQRGFPTHAVPLQRNQSVSFEGGAIWRTDMLLENRCKTDGRRYGEELTRTEIVDFYQNAV